MKLLFCLFSYETPLHYAVKYNIIEVVQVLLEHPSLDVNVENIFIFIKYHTVFYNILKWYFIFVSNTILL